MPTFSQQPRCFTFACLFALTVVGLTQAASDESGANVFRQSNPGYVQRAGSFYETDYLPGAVKGLKAVFAPQQLDDATARGLLLKLIYSFLEHYTADGGAITRRHHAAVLDKLDKQVRRLADDPAILARYEKWKLGSDADYPNPLNFLTLLSRQSPPMKLELNQSLKDAGWRIRSLETLKETGRYADVLNMEPYQVIRLERRGVNNSPGESVLLLLYRLTHAPRLIKEMDRLATSPAAIGSRFETPTLFWRTRTHVIFLQQEHRNHAGDELNAIKTWVRTQWMQE